MQVDQNTSGAPITNAQLEVQRLAYDVFRAEVVAAAPTLAGALPDACSIQLSVLEDWLAYAKKALYQNGVVSPGIGFVFAKYRGTAETPGMNPAYEDKVHVVLKAIDMGLMDAGGTSGVNFEPNIPNQPSIKPMNFMNISPPKAPIVVI